MKNPYEKADRHTELMRSMAEKVGVDWSELVARNPELVNKFRHAALTCEQCKSVGECRDWQEKHEHSEEAPGYCLNQKLLDELGKC